jgi:hypothetical protein
MDLYSRDLRERLLEKIEKDKLTGKYTKVANLVGMPVGTLYTFINGHRPMRPANNKLIENYIQGKSPKQEAELVELFCNFENPECQEYGLKQAYELTIAALPENLKSLISFEDFKQESTPEFLKKCHGKNYHVCHSNLIKTNLTTFHMDVQQDLIDIINRVYREVRSQSLEKVTTKKILSSAIAIGFEQEHRNKLVNLILNKENNG